ncbi:MAG TPA: hypothetical protein DEF07_03135 [Nitrosomonas sp.]|nr:hypothetical protein [Nitrosomonas sp.]
MSIISFCKDFFNKIGLLLIPGSSEFHMTLFSKYYDCMRRENTFARSVSGKIDHFYWIDSHV